MLRVLTDLTLPYLVPVVRAADDSKPGTGLVSLSPDDPCLVIGHGTKFLSELKPKSQIMLPKSVGSIVAEVIEVLSDEKLRIKKEEELRERKAQKAMDELNKSINAPK